MTTSSCIIESLAVSMRSFDEVVLFQRDGQTLFTHFPLGYSRACDATRGTPDEKYYRMHKTFHALDARLLGVQERAPIVNYHGHIHAGPFAYPIAGVTYCNVALDILTCGQREERHSQEPGAAP
jgi:hypothetical protein